jgi:mono/diheme cytochrome c family protein
MPATPTPGTAATEKLNLDEFTPPGVGRDLVIGSCGVCHAFVCAIRGQRTAEHWKNVKHGHEGRVPGLTDEEYDALFAYLVENFNDTKPEPKLPPLLQQLGCSAAAGH